MDPMSLLALPFLSAVNHLLRAEPWARERLRPYAGKVAALSAPPFRFAFTVDSEGLLQRTDDGIVPAVSIAVPLSALPRFATEGQQAMLADVKLEGDAQFAQAIAEVAQHLRWEPEEDLSKVVGDIPARRIVGTARAMGADLVRGGQRASANLAEYFLEEDPRLVRPRAVAEFTDGVQGLRDDVERLAKRVALLAEKAPR